MSLGDPAGPSEGGAIVLPHLGHHHEVVPVKAEESLCPRSHAISYQDLHAFPPVQGIIEFSEVREDLIEDLFPHQRKLTEQIGL